MRTNLLRLLAALPLALGLVVQTVPTALAHEVGAGDLTIIHAWARPNLPNRPTAAYMSIANDGTRDDRLIAVSSPAFETIELHTVVKQGDVLSMQPIDGIDVPAEDAAVLEPGGHHLMLFGARKAFKAGESFPVTLTFEDLGPVEVTVKVEKRTHSSGGGHGDHGTHGAGGDGNGEAGHGAHKKHGSD